MESSIFSLSHDLNYESQFEYAWFRQIKDLRKWRRLKLSTIDKLVVNEPDVASFTSVQKYADPVEKMDEPFWMDLAFDFDCAENLESAKKETILVVNFFLDILPKEAVRIYFSGSKGFGIVIHRKITGIIPFNKAHFYQKNVALELSKKFSLETIDFQIYISKRLLRIPNTKHEKSGLYKIELDPSELNLSIDEIKKLAEKSRDFTFYEDEVPELNENLVRILQNLSSKTKIIDTSQLPDLTSRLKTLEKDPMCISDLLENSIKAPNERNTATMVLATYFKEKGIFIDETIKTLVEWANRIPVAFRRIDTNAVRDSTITCIKTIYNNRGKDYKFGCPYVWNLTDIRCNKTNCTLNPITALIETKLRGFGWVREGENSYEIRTTVQNEYGDDIVVWEPITNFLVKYDRIIEGEDSKIISGKVKKQNGEIFPFDWDARLLANATKFEEELQYMCPTGLIYVSDKIKVIKTLINFFNEKTPIVKGHDSIGSHGNAFVTKSFYISNGEISHNEKFPVINPLVENYDFINISLDECKMAADFIMNELLSMHDYSVTIPLLGEVGRCPLIPKIGNMRYVTYFEGITGAGKTIVQKSFLNFYCDLSLTEKTSSDKRQSMASMTDTVNRVEYHGYFLINVPYIWDDFKKRLDMQPQATISAIQNYYNQSGRGRLTSEIKERKSYYIRANLWNNGEEIPEGHASALERCLVYRVRYNLDVDRIDSIESKRKMLLGITPHYIAWAQKNGPQLWKHKMEVKHPRLVPYGEQNLTGLNTFLTFLMDNHFINKERLSEILQRGKDAIHDAIELTKLGSETESSVIYFVDGLRELITTQTGVLSTGSHSADSRQVIIGIDKPIEGQVWIFPKKAMEQVSKLCFNKGNMFSNQSLGRDLLDDGYIVQKRSNGSPSMAKWVNNSTVNVWVFDRIKLLGQHSDAEPIDELLID